MKTTPLTIAERLLTEDPGSILDTTFSEQDIEDLHSIKHELGICIKWGEVTNRVFKSLMGGADALVFLETAEGDPQVVKRNPYEALFAKDQRIINGPKEKSKMSREYILLHITKKLLGALKTRVNQKLAEFEVIDDETEGSLFDLVREGEGADEEEMDLVSGNKTEIEARIISKGTKGCDHKRSTYTQVPPESTVSGEYELHQYCKTCKVWVGVQEMGKRQKTGGFNFKAREKKCYHKGRWKEGEEGKIAICSLCSEVIPDPQRFEWMRVGLEPFGDDPAADEILHIEVGKYHTEVLKAEEA